VADDGLLTGDFYRFERLLSGPERETLHRVREWLAAEVVPIANRCWERAEFPFELIPRFAELGIVGIAYDEVPGAPPSALLAGFLSMELSHADPSFSTFYGVHSGLAMGSIARCGSAEQRARWLPAMGGWRRSARSR
jgi:glutaryl-CoA dehydrogenase